MAPKVRVVVVNYNRGDLTIECLDSLLRVDWPASDLEVVVVDNGSTDGSEHLIREAHRWVTLIAAGTNLGFAGGNNAALRDLAGVDYVALLNNDTTVRRDWLAPLVAAMEDDPGVGAACSKILFRDAFAEFSLLTRQGGLRLSGVEVDGIDRLTDAQFVSGWSGLQPGPPQEEWCQRSAAAALVRVPGGSSARFRFAGDGPTTVQVAGGGGTVTLAVQSRPQWYDVPIGGEYLDVVNNTGNRLLAGGYGADRGILEPDRGQYDVAAEVFAWCGASVLLRPDYLHDVGLFDERLFLYYEDFDLSWRGRSRGWRYVYAPTSVVRHVHAATTIEGSALSSYYIERNRLLVLAKNAPGGMAARAAARYLLITGSYAGRDIVRPLLHGHTARPAVPARRLRAFGAYLRLLPVMLASRRRERRRRTVPDEDVLAWRDVSGRGADR